MAAAHRENFARQGIRSIEPAEGLALLGRLLRGSAAQVGVLPVRWSEFDTSLSFPERDPFLSEVAGTANTPALPAKDASAQAASAPAAPALLQRLEEAWPGERLSILHTHLQSEVCRVLGLSASARPDVSQGFFDLGMDSLMIAELNRNLHTAVGQPFPLSVMFDHANINALAHYLARHVLMLPLEAEAVEAAETTTPEDEAVGAALEKLEQLSDEEALALLTEKLPLD